MDYSKFRKSSTFVDKSHAVCMVACLEYHFQRISKLLDGIGVPKEKEGVALTVEQRVNVLATAYSWAFQGKDRERETLIEALGKIEDPDPDFPDFCPEELQAALDDDSKE